MMETLRIWIKMKTWNYLTVILQSSKVEESLLYPSLQMEMRKEEFLQTRMREMVTMSNPMILIKSGRKEGITSCFRTSESLCLTK